MGNCSSNSRDGTEETNIEITCNTDRTNAVPKPIFAQKIRKGKLIDIYTDGACLPGERSAVGAFFYIDRKLNFGERLNYPYWETADIYDMHDNNRAEMYAVIYALKRLLEWCNWPENSHRNIRIRTDSKFVVNMVEKGINGHRNWQKFADVSKKLFQLMEKFQGGVRFQRVDRNQHYGNREADRLARDAMKNNVFDADED